MTEWEIVCALALAQTDYIAGVPGAYERYQYYSAELERLSAIDGEKATSDD